MKKLIVSALLIAFGSVYAHAMDDAPSVSIGGSAKLGVKNSDDGKADTEDLSTVAEYDISLSSSGVTDGGLEFGASINIDGRGNNHIGGDGFQVYIGASDGSWKLQFGEDGDHAGIDVVGNIGLANADDISGKTMKTIEGVSVLTNAAAKELFTNPSGDGTVWDASILLPLINASLGTKYTAFGAEVNQLNLFINNGIATPIDNLVGSNLDPLFAKNGDNDNFQLPELVDGDTATKTAAAISATTTDAKQERDISIGTPKGVKLRRKDGMNEGSNRTNIQLSGNIAGFEYRLSSGEGIKTDKKYDAGWSFGAKYALNNLSFGLGLDHNKVQALSAGGSFDGNNIDFTYIRQNNTGDTLSYYVMDIEALDPVSGSAEGAGNRAVVGARSTSYTVENKYKAYGVKFGRDLGSGTSISATYSKLDNEVTSTSDTRLELNFDYSLGGGATFYVEIDKDDLESKSTDTTNIEAGVKMKF